MAAIKMDPSLGDAHLHAGSGSGEFASHVLFLPTSRLFGLHFMPCASAPAAVSFTRASKRRVESRLPSLCVCSAKCVSWCELAAAWSLVVGAASRLLASFVPARSTVLGCLHIHGDVPAFA
jgi:hypothetical protein